MTNQTPSPKPEQPGHPTVYRASWVCPVDRPPIQNGCVVVKDEPGDGLNQGFDRRVIANVCRFEDYQGPSQQVIDLGDGAIVPGLINAHSHLEFSDLPKPLGQTGIGFTDWIRLIVQSRNDSNDGSPARKSAAIKLGIEQSVRSGVAAVGEIATMPFELSDYASNAPISILHFLEQLGSDEAVLDAQAEQLASHLSTPILSSGPAQDSADGASGIRLAQSSFGASPHAPYSCHPKLVEQICRIAAAQKSIVAMHLAETKQERELLESRSGNFVELLKDFGVWNPEFFSSSRSVLSTLQTLSSCRSLIVHGNYLSEAELDFIAGHRETMSIVFCPRTHAFFKHDSYPLQQILDRGIGLAVGTDSLASNPDLDLFEELKQIAKSFPQLGSEQILKLGTANGAAAIGMASQLGTLTPGKSAVLGFVESTDADSSGPLEGWLFSPTSNCRRI